MGMTAAGERDSLAVRLAAGPRAVWRWAATSLPEPDSQALTSRGGCLHPFNLVKLAVLLTIVLLLPLFFLPVLLVRLVTVGRTGLR